MNTVVESRTKQEMNIAHANGAKYNDQDKVICLLCQSHDRNSDKQKRTFTFFATVVVEAKKCKLNFLRKGPKKRRRQVHVYNFATC